MTPNSWTPERTAQLRLLHADGWSARQIALKFGDITRNSVCGKISRLGLPIPAIKRPTSRIKYPHRPATAHSTQLVAVADAVSPPGSVGTFSDADIPLGQRSTTMGLTRYKCHYPIGDPQDVDFYYCGGPVFRVPYCRQHFELCYYPPRPR